MGDNSLSLKDLCKNKFNLLPFLLLSYGKTSEGKRKADQRASLLGNMGRYKPHGGLKTV